MQSVPRAAGLEVLSLNSLRNPGARPFGRMSRLSSGLCSTLGLWQLQLVRKLNHSNKVPNFKFLEPLLACLASSILLFPSA